MRMLDIIYVPGGGTPVPGTTAAPQSLTLDVEYGGLSVTPGVELQDSQTRGEPTVYLTQAVQANIYTLGEPLL